MAWFVRRHPLFVAAVAVVLVLLVGAERPVVGVVTGILLGVFGGVCVGWRHGLAWGMCGVVALGWMTWRISVRDGLEERLVGVATERAEGFLLEDGKGVDGFWVARVRLDGREFGGAVVQWEGQGDAPVAGARVRAGGRFEGLPVARNPGAFDEAGWLRNQGVAAVFRAGRHEVEVGDWARWSAVVRHGFRDGVAAGLPEDSQEARVIRAVVIGEYPQDSDELIGAFRDSGTLHVFSVSGLHVGLVGGIGWLVLTGLGVSRRRAVLVLVGMMFGYAWLVGNGPPALRSAWMGGVFLGAFVFRRRPDLLNSLGAVLLVALILDGRLLFQPGVQLSYGVVAAIAVGSSLAGRWFAWMRTPELYLPESLMSRGQRWWLGFRRWLAGSVSVSSAAWVGSTPLTVVHFGLVTPISVLATVVLVPLVFVILALGLFSAAVHPLVPWVSEGMNRVNGVFANWCAGTAEGFAAIPGGNFQVRRAHEPFLLVYDLEYGAGAACFSGGRDGAVLVDCGDRYSFEWEVRSSLKRLGVVPDSVVLSHPDGGHLGGGGEVLDALPIRQVVLPVRRSRSPAFQAWAEGAAKGGVRTVSAAEGAMLPFPGGANLEVIHAPDPMAVNAIADERVAVYRLHWRGWRLLFVSDAGYSTEERILRAGRDVSADVVIAGRHRRSLTLGDDFLDAVNPQVIVASNSAFPVEERLPGRQADYWRKRGISVVDQRETGGVTMRVTSEGVLEVSGFVDGSVLRINPR